MLIVNSRLKRRLPPPTTPNEARTLPDPPPRYVSVGRNEDCPCGSGKKFKRCCLGETSPFQARRSVRQPIMNKADGDQRESPLPLLRRLSLQDIFLLHAIIAITVLMETVVFNAPLGIFIYPGAVALWSAARLNTFRRISYVNPFTITSVATWFIFGVYAVIGRVHEPWDYQSTSKQHPLDLIVSVMISGLGYAFVSVLTSLVLLAVWKPLRSGRDVR